MYFAGSGVGDGRGVASAGTAAAEQSLLLQKGYWENLLQDLTAEEKTTLNALLEKMERRAARVVVPKDRNGQGPFQQDEI